MAKERTSFDLLCERARGLVEEWGRSVADGPLPVPLEDLAARYKVRRIEFEPFLSKAGIEKDGDGFLICMNSRAAGIDQTEGTVLEVSGHWCRLHPHIRFTIAHEIAHLIILQLAGGNWRSDLFRRHAVALENECSRMARALLLPKERLRREIGDRLFDVDTVRKLLTEFRVSPEVFVWRLRLPDMQAEFRSSDGLLAFAREQPDGSVGLVARAAWGTIASNRWKQILEERGRPRLEMLHLRPGICDAIRKLDNVDESTVVIWREGQVFPCRVKSCRLYSNPSGFLIGIQVTGEIDAQKET